MTFQEYSNYFKSIIDKDITELQAPYDNPEYIDYTRLNWSRMNRWMKTGKLSDEILRAVKKIDTQQQWIIITEPWCGDAAHSLPFLELLSRENPFINTDYELRDSKPFRIKSYLTNGAKSIPQLIIRTADGKDKCAWGPRPKSCQKIYNKLVKEKAPFEEVKIVLQKWYNADKGKELQEELLDLL